MFLARIDGLVVSTVKHPTLEGCSLLVGQRLEGDGQPNGVPLLIVDWMGAGRGATVLVSTDGDICRQRLGNSTPARMVVAGIVDHVHIPKERGA